MSGNAVLIGLMLIPAGLLVFARQRHVESQVRWYLPATVVSLLLLAGLAISAFGFLYGLLVPLSVLIYIGIGWLKQDGIPWGRPLAAVASVLVFLIAMMKVAVTFAGCNEQPDKRAALQQASDINRAKMFRMGQLLAKNFKGGETLIVMPAEFRDNSAMQDEFEAFTQAVGPSFSIGEPVFDRLASKNPTAAIDVDTLDELLSVNQGYDLVVCFVPLPLDFKRMTFWKQKERPRFVLVGSNVNGLKQLIKLGLLTGAIVRKPITIADLKAMNDSDPDQLAAESLLCATAANIDALSAKHPNVFRDDKEMQAFLDKHRKPE